MEAKEFNELMGKIKYNKAHIERIYEEYAPAIKMHLSRRFGNAVDTEDVVHEVFIMIMQTDWSGLEYVQTPHAWLYTIADRKALDFIKLKRVDYPLEKYERSLFCFNLDDIMIAGDVKSALGYLENREAEIIYFNKYEGYTFKEIAEFTGLKPENVRVIASRAYKKLKKICNKFHIEFV